LEELMKLAKLAEKRPVGGGVVLEVARKLRNKEKKEVERV